MTTTEEPWPFKDSDRHGWPTGTDGDKLFESKLSVRVKRAEQEIARNTADRAAARALELEYYKGVLEVAKGSIERARAAADFVQKASGGIGVIYAAVLGVAFSVSERPLPARGILPAIFLGVSVVCATYFLAWLPARDPDPQEATKDESPPGTPLRDRLAILFIRWNRRAAVDRRRWLRASVVALAASIALLPAPFVPLGDPPASEAATFPLPGAAAPGANIELRKILYQAQVTEAAKTDRAPLTGDEDWRWWVLGAALGLLVIVLPQVPREPKAGTPSTASG